MSGNTTETKAEAAGLLKDMGWTDDEIVDLGGIETVTATEAYLMMFASLAGALKTDAVNIRSICQKRDWKE